MRKLGWFLLFLLLSPLAARADGVALAKAGYAAQQEGKWDDAIRLYGEALDSADLDDRGRLLVLGLRGNALAIAGRQDEAIASFDQAIRLDPNDPKPLVGRGMVHLQRGELDAAIADDDAALLLKPSNVFARANRALAAFYRGDFPAAVEGYASLHADDAGDAEYLLWLHVARTRAGADDDAAFRKDAAAVDATGWPGPVIAVLLGQATEAELRAAADQGSRAERIQHSCDASFFLGEEALRQGQSEEAKQLFRLVLADCDLYRTNFAYFSRAYGAAAAELKRLP